MSNGRQVPKIVYRRIYESVTGLIRSLVEDTFSAANRNFKKNKETYLANFLSLRRAVPINSSFLAPILKPSQITAILFTTKRLQRASRPLIRVALLKTFVQIAKSLPGSYMPFLTLHVPFTALQKLGSLYSNRKS